jgi:hypothetical protein
MFNKFMWLQNVTTTSYRLAKTQLMAFFIVQLGLTEPLLIDYVSKEFLIRFLNFIGEF